MPDEPSTPPPSRSWLDRISQALSGELRSREDLIEELHAAQAKGLISADTAAMMEGAIAVSDQSVGDVMVPRSQMVSIPVDAPLKDVLQTVVESGHSRFPVHGEDRDQILGVLLAKDLLRGCAEGTHPASISTLLRPVALIPESKRLNVLLKEFRLSRNHMAVVVDEYGGVAGLVTIEDVLEQIVGEIDDEHDDAPGTVQQIAELPDGSFRIDALTAIEDFNARFDANLSDAEYDTIGGLVVAAMGHLPESGEELDLDRFHFRVMQADARRVHVLQMTPRPAGD